MLRRQAYRFALRPSGQQLRNLRQFAGSCRFVYNKALALNTTRYNKKEKRLGYAGLGALLPNWKSEHPFLSEVPAQAQQNTGQVSADNRKTQAKFVCLKCGLSANADFISAVNIREAGLASLACAQPWHAVSASWQEPTEGIHRLGVEPVGIPGL